MPNPTIPLMIYTVLLILFIRAITTRNCDEESYYYDEKDIENLRCTLEALEKAYNGTNATMSDEQLAHPVGTVLRVTEKIINPAYEDVFPEVYCKRCKVRLVATKVAISVECHQCTDVTGRSNQVPGEYKKVFIY